MSKDIPPDLLERITWAKKQNSQDPNVIKKIDYETKPCEYCNLPIENFVETMRLCQSPVLHWRRRCQTCKLIWNPETQAYDLDSTQSLAFFRAYYSNDDK